MDALVKRLSQGKHKATFEARIDTLEEIKERLENGFVFVTFAQKSGETELGINVDQKLTDLKDADFKKGTGKVHVEGTCELNYHKVRCISDFDLKTKKGKSYLKVLTDKELETEGTTT